MKIKKMIAAIVLSSSFICVKAQTSVSTTTLNTPATNGTGTSTVTQSVGVNTTAPASTLHVNAPAGSSTGEWLFKGTVSDAPDFFSIQNATGGNGIFIPTLWGHNQSNYNRGLFLISSTNSSGDVANGTPLIDLNARTYGFSTDYKVGTSGTVSNRPILQVSNFSTPLMTISPNGNVGIGTTQPAANLTVAGSTNPYINIMNSGSNGSLGIGIATCNTCWANFAQVNDAVLFNYHGNMILKNANPGSSIFFSTIASGTGNDNKRMEIKGNGQIDMGTGKYNGTTHSDYLVSISGKAIAESVYVLDPTNWADYVFDKDYKLASLEEVEAFVKENKHLPDVPSEKEVKENGINVADMDATLLRKIEELTLHMIEMKKEIEVLKKENTSLKSGK